MDWAHRNGEDKAFLRRVASVQFAPHLEEERKEGREKILPKLKIKPSHAVSMRETMVPLQWSLPTAASPFMPASQY